MVFWICAAQVAEVPSALDGRGSGVQVKVNVQVLDEALFRSGGRKQLDVATSVDFHKC
jgi:hypothetical protein